MLIVHFYYFTTFNPGARWHRRWQVRPRTINSFSKSEYWIRFLTTKQDLFRLKHALRLNEIHEVKLDNGSKLLPEEVMLIGLNRFVYPQKFGEMVAVYGRDWSQISRAFRWFADYIVHNASLRTF